MKRSRFTEEQIIGVLREQEAGVAVPAGARRQGSAPRPLATVDDNGSDHRRALLPTG
ncbi:MAG: transposase [Alphaproteobacteria bacterium]